MNEDIQSRGVDRGGFVFADPAVLPLDLYSGGEARTQVRPWFSV